MALASRTARSDRRDRRAFELGFAEGRPRDVWRRLRYRDRSGSKLERPGGRKSAPILESGSTGRPETAPGSRAGIPRDRRRCGPDHDHPRRQGPRVPDHDRLRHVDGAAGPAGAGGGRFSGRGRAGYRFGRKCVTEEFAERKPIDEQMGSTNASGSSMSPAPAPVTISSCRCSASSGRRTGGQEANERRAAPPGHGRSGRQASRRGRRGDLRGPHDRTSGAAGRATAVRTMGSRTRTAVLAQSHPSTVAATALTDEGMADAGAGARRRSRSGHAISICRRG